MEFLEAEEISAIEKEGSLPFLFLGREERILHGVVLEDASLKGKERKR